MTDNQVAAFMAIEEAKENIRRLPRFHGQQQVIKALNRILNLAVWDK